MAKIKNTETSQHDHTSFLNGTTRLSGSNSTINDVIEVFGDVRHTSTESLIDYARRIEAQAQPLAVCQITHPDAKDGAIHEGAFAGIRLVRGDEVSALLSDGSTL